MTEFRLRRELERTGETVTSQTKKQIQKPNPEMDVLPVPGSQGNEVPGRRNSNSTCYQYEARIVEGTQTAWEGVRKLLCVNKDPWNVGEKGAWE